MLLLDDETFLENNSGERVTCHLSLVSRLGGKTRQRDSFDAIKTLGNCFDAHSFSSLSMLLFAGLVNYVRPVASPKLVDLFQVRSNS